MPDTREEEHVTFAVEYERDHRVIAANGCFGGPTPRGDFGISFYVEVPKLPDQLVYRLNPDGTLGARVEGLSGRSKLARQIGVTVILSMESAERIANWMLKRTTEYRQRQEQRRKK